MTTQVQPRRGLRPSLVGALLVCLACAARGQNLPPVPVITPPVDTATAARAITNGKVLLENPTWKTKLSMNVLDMKVLGPMLVCSGGAGQVASTSGFATMQLDFKTGRNLGETGKIYGPMTWIENGLFSVNAGDGRIKLLRWSPPALSGISVWETNYKAKAQADAGGIIAKDRRLGSNAVFANQQIIAGEFVEALQQGPNGPASLTIRSFDRSTGGLQWDTPVPGETRSAEVRVAEKAVYVLVTGGTALPVPSREARAGFVMALSAVDGKVLWKSETGVAPKDGAVLGAGLVTLGENSEVTAYDGATGKVEWHTQLSTECDPAKSNFGLLSYGNVYLHQGRVIAALTPTGTKNLGGIALLDLQSGRQTGFFDAKGFDLDPGSLQFHGDVLIGQAPRLTAHGLPSCAAGINLKTLQVAWLVPAWASTVADGILYCANTPDVNGTRTPGAEVVALPLGNGLPMPSDLP